MLFPGWFYGPEVSLLDCLAYFFSADELKGDNIYRRDKCKKLWNGFEYSQVVLVVVEIKYFTLVTVGDMATRHSAFTSRGSGMLLPCPVRSAPG